MSVRSGFDWNTHVGLNADDLGAPVGFECWPLARRVYQDALEIVLPAHDTVAVADARGRARAIAAEAAGWVRVPFGEERAFDVAAFGTPALPRHVAVVVEPGLLLDVPRGGCSGTLRYDRRVPPLGLVAIHRHPLLA